MSDPGKDSRGHNLRGIKSRLFCFSYCKTIVIDIVSDLFFLPFCRIIIYVSSAFCHIL